MSVKHELETEFYPRIKAIASTVGQMQYEVRNSWL